MTVINWPSLGSGEAVNKGELSGVQKEALEQVLKAEEKAAKEVKEAKELAAGELYKSSMIDVRKYVGLTPTGAKDMFAKLQEALTHAEEEAAEKGKGSIVLLPPWQMMIGGTLQIGDFVTLLGHAKASILKLGAGVNAALLISRRFNAGGENGGTENTQLLHCYFDGNFAENGATPAGTVLVGLDGIRHIGYDIEVRNGVINFEHLQSRNKSPGTEKLEDSMFDCIGAKDPQEQNIVIAQHDAHLSRAYARSNVAGFANIKLTGAGCWAYNCHAYGNAKYQYELLAGELVNCIGEGAREGQVAILGDGHSIRGGRYFYGGGADGKIGFKFGDGTHTANSTQIIGTRIENCTNGTFDFTSATASNSYINAWINGAEGNECVGNPGSSIVFEIKNSGGINFGSGGSLPETASAEELELPTTCRRRGSHVKLKLTGGAEIKKWKVVPPAGTIITIIFTNVAKMIKGENLKISANFEGGANRVITLVSDGTNTFEMSRSIN